MFKIALPNLASGKLPFFGVANIVYDLLTTWDESLNLSKLILEKGAVFDVGRIHCKKVMLYSKYYLGVWCYHNPLSTSVSKIFFSPDWNLYSCHGQIMFKVLWLKNNASKVPLPWVTRHDKTNDMGRWKNIYLFLLTK